MNETCPHRDGTGSLKVSTSNVVTAGEQRVKFNSDEGK